MVEAVRGRGTWAVLMAGLLVGVLATLGCGPDEPPADKCAETTCHFGTCAPETGECVNKSACQADVDCLPGYACGGDGTCSAEQSCSGDGDCSTGVCDGTACVNPAQCESDGDCLEGTHCGEDGTCKPDPCNQKDCQRGVCERGTGKCVSADSCNADNELYRCVDGQKCIDGSCKEREAYCETLTCERGVCSFEEASCVNAMNCDGDDSRCLEGHFCADGNCQRNLCERDDVECNDGGVCDPATGKCENAMSCSSHADCRSNPEHVCIDGTCRLADSACQGCPGNKNCEVDRDAMTATCVEPDECETSLDCDDGRQCGGKSCIDNVSCREDRYEPNNTMSEATDLSTVSVSGRLVGSVCQGDTDRFTFNTANRVDSGVQGTVEVAITVPARDTGLGDVEMTLVGPDDSEVASKTLPANAEKERITITTGLSTSGRGEYAVEIGAGDNVTGAGVGYELAVNILTGGAMMNCNNAETIDVGQRLDGTTAGAASSSLGVSCNSRQEGANEKIYKLDLQTSQRLSVVVEPENPTANPVIAVRDQCTERQTEVDCTNARGINRPEELVRNFSAGTHYLLVETTAGDGEPFEIRVDQLSKTTCTDQGNYCSDGQTAQTCDLEGGGFNQVSCDDGCHPSSGRCFPPQGNVCNGAPTVSSDDSQKTRTIDLKQFRDSYALGDGSCLGSGASRTGGPDGAFTLELKPKQSVTVTAEFANEVEGSIYLAEQCSDVAGTCITGAQGSTMTETKETLTYSNVSQNAQTRTLIVDTAAAQHFGSVDLTFSYKSVICTPGSKTCNANGNVDTCQEFGTAYKTTETCGLTCTGGTCDGETCTQPKDITMAARQGSGTTVTADWGDFAGDYTSTCGDLGSGATGGGDAVFRIDLRPDDVIEATLGGSSTDVGMYLTSGCNGTNSCLANVKTSGQDGTLSYLGSSSGETVYLHADASGSSSGQFTLDVQTNQRICQPDTVLGCSSGDVQYCSPSGIAKNTYTCGSNGCSMSTCNDRVSEHCFDAENITTAARGPGGVTKSPDWGNLSGDLSFQACGISAAESSGPDAVYRVDLKSDETLTTSLEGQLNGPDSSLRLMEGCLDAGNKCLKGSYDNDGVELRHDATQAQSLYIVGDWNSDPGSGYDLDTAVRTRCSTKGQTTCAGSDTVQLCNTEALETPFSCSNCCKSAAGGYDQAGISIPKSGTTRTMSLSGCTGTVNEVIVGLDIDILWRGDLGITLRSPNGTRVDLEQTAGFNTDGFGGLKYYPRDYSPEESLSAFQGDTPNGTWELAIEDSDDGGLRSGTLESWSLAVACD